MKTILKLHNLVLIFSSAAMLSFLGRSFLDYGYVFPEFGIGMPDLFFVTVGELAFFGGWLWALIAAGGASRRGLIGLLVYNVLLLLFGISTLTSLCPSPCGTVWPLGEILIWSNVVIGFIASYFVVRQLVIHTDNLVLQGAAG